MKAPHNMQLRVGAGIQIARLKITERDREIAGHAAIECDRAAGGDRLRAAQMLFDQAARHPGAAGDLMMQAGVARLAPDHGEGGDQ